MTWPYRITSVEADAGRRLLTLTWADGGVTVKDMQPVLARKRAFRPLADPALFAQVRIINDGRAIAWTGDLDMCADALWFDAHPEDNPYADAAPAQVAE